MSEKIYLGQAENLVLASSNVILGGAATFTSTIFYVGGYTNIVGFIYSNVASATNGLVIAQAADSGDFVLGTPPITRSRFTYSAADTDFNAFAVELTAPFVRISYTNGVAAQTIFRMWFAAKAAKGS